jgi:small GTP-binding protein
MIKKYFLKLQWDCGGQDRFRAIIPNYLRNTNGVCLLYDITNPKTIENVNEWLQLIYEHGPTDVSIMLVGNKTDLEQERLIPMVVGQVCDVIPCKC